MSDVQKLSLAVLHTVSEFLALLPADQLEALADGSARLTVIPKDATVPLQLVAAAQAPKKRTAAAKASTKPPSAETLALRDRLETLQTREGADALLKSQTGQTLKDLCAAYGIGASGTKGDLTQRLVEFTIGNRLNSAAIRQL